MVSPEGIVVVVAGDQLETSALEKETESIGSDAIKESLVGVAVGLFVDCGVG